MSRDVLSVDFLQAQNVRMKLFDLGTKNSDSRREFRPLTRLVVQVFQIKAGDAQVSIHYVT